MKNHKMIDGRLLQTNKRFSALKESQKTRIAEWIYLSYRAYYEKYHKLPGKKTEDEILFPVFEQIEEAQIWIPDGEIYQYYRKRQNKLAKRLKKDFAEDFMETENENIERN